MGNNIVSGHFKQLLDSNVFIFIIKMVEDNAHMNLAIKNVKICSSLIFYLEC